MKKMMAAAFMVCAMTGAVLVQAQQAPQPPVRKHRNIQQRKENQQQRIGEGVENGSLTAGEASRLEKKEAGINREERQMKKDGDFTAAERATVQHQQNQLSRQIYNQKHDAQHQNLNPQSEVGKRDREQQKRIGEGIENGSLTAREASRLEGKEAALNHEQRQMRHADGGTLSPQDRAKVNRQQNRVSRQIYRQKHDAQHR